MATTIRAIWFSSSAAVLCLAALPGAVGSPGVQHTRDGAAGTPWGWAQVNEPSDETITCANRTRRSWRLEPTPAGPPGAVPNDELVPRCDALPFPFECPFETKYLLARRVARAMGNQWLVGCDLGTHGGGLWLVGPTGQREAKLWGERVWDIVELGGVLFALTEDAEGNGLVLKLEASGGTWASRPAIRAPGYPIGLFLKDGSTLVLTRAGLFRAAHGAVASLLRFDLGRLLPTSTAITDKGDIYVAMRHFLLRLRQVSGEWVQEWLAPVDCQAFRKRDRGPCDCMTGFESTTQHAPCQ